MSSREGDPRGTFYTFLHSGSSMIITLEEKNSGKGIEGGWRKKKRRVGVG